MEKVDIVNEKGDYLRTQCRDEILNENEYIRTVHIYLVTREKEIYIQQRSEIKEENPNLWEAVGGGVMAGEDIFTAAIREIKEEIGRDYPKNRLILIGTKTCGRYLVNAFVAIVDSKEMFIPQVEEVKQTMFVDFKEIMNLINNDRFYSTSFDLFQKFFLENLKDG